MALVTTPSTYRLNPIGHSILFATDVPVFRLRFAWNQLEPPPVVVAHQRLPASPIIDFFPVDTPVTSLVVRPPNAAIYAIDRPSPAPSEAAVVEVMPTLTVEVPLSTRCMSPESASVIPIFGVFPPRHVSPVPNCTSSYSCLMSSDYP
jgi:hypothetical protein